MGKVRAFLAQLLAVLTRIAVALEARSAEGDGKDEAARAAITSQAKLLDTIRAKLEVIEKHAAELAARVEPAEIAKFQQEVITLRSEVRKLNGRVSKDPEFTPAVGKKQRQADPLDGITILGGAPPVEAE